MPQCQLHSFEAPGLCRADGIVVTEPDHDPTVAELRIDQPSRHPMLGVYVRPDMCSIAFYGDAVVRDRVVRGVESTEADPEAL